MRFAPIAVLAVAAALVSCKGSEPKPIRITISPETADLAVGATQQFSATVSGTDNTDVTWETSVASVATVSSSGLVTAVGAGTASITATSSENTEILTSATVTVTSNATALTSGVAVTNISGALGSERHYRITVPTGATQLSVTTNGTGDLDLYVKRGTQPTTTSADCSSEGTSAAESCVIANPQAGEWYIMLYGYTAYSNVSLTATVTGGTTPPASGFTISNSTTTPSVVRGSATSLTVTAARAGTFTGAIDLTVTGLPAGVTASFAPATLSSSQSTSTLTLTASASATTGPATITVRGNSTGQTERTATATLTVNAASSSSISLQPGSTSITIARGQFAYLGIYTSSNGSSATGSLAVEGLASGVTPDWPVNQDEAIGSATGFFQANDYAENLRLNVSASAALGTTSFTVRATPGNGIPAATTTIQLTIVDAQAIGNAAWTQLFLGTGVSCGRRADQKTYCWGSSNLGDATSGAKRVPGIAALGRSFTNATFGAAWGCGIDSGAAWCWGSNEGAGYLGNGGTNAPLLMPVPVSGGHTFAAISAGASHTCALDTTGAAWCWGMQLGGALGDGVIATTNGEYKTTPTAVLGGITFAKLSVGQGHSCGLTAAGVAWCWGFNLYGQLGDGTTTTRAQPTQVGGGLTFASISAGGNHTCALTAAGKPYCWGSYSQVGDATAPTQDVKAPRAIPTTDTFAEISAGWNHSCAITNSGTAYCWGNNFYGQLGNGASGASANSRALVPVSGGLSFAKIAVRNQVSCGVTTANAVRCWGFNTGGTVGDGTTTHRSTPALVKTF